MDQSMGASKGMNIPPALLRTCQSVFLEQIGRLFECCCCSAKRARKVFNLLALCFKNIHQHWDWTLERIRQEKKRTNVQRLGTLLPTNNVNSSWCITSRTKSL